jgi:hypothetical protein
MPDVFIAEDKNPIEPIRDKRFSTEKQLKTQKVKNDKKTVVQQAQKSGNMHIFSAFCENPDRVTFQTQEENEKILLFMRKSFITNIPWIITSIIFALAPLLALPFLHFFGSQLSFLPGTYIFVIILFYYLVVITIAFINFITWFFNISIVTQDRIIDIEFSELVYKNIAETKLDLVQDVSYLQIGVIRALFDYGDMLVQTAGTVDNFDIHAIPKPERAVQVVESLIGKGRQAGGL